MQVVKRKNMLYLEEMARSVMEGSLERALYQWALLGPWSLD